MLGNKSIFVFRSSIDSYRYNILILFLYVFKTLLQDTITSKFTYKLILKSKPEYRYLPFTLCKTFLINYSTIFFCDKY